MNANIRIFLGEKWTSHSFEEIEVMVNNSQAPDQYIIDFCKLTTDQIVRVLLLFNLSLSIVREIEHGRLRDQFSEREDSYSVFFREQGLDIEEAYPVHFVVVPRRRAMLIFRQSIESNILSILRWSCTHLKDGHFYYPRRDSSADETTLQKPTNSKRKRKPILKPVEILDHVLCEILHDSLYILDKRVDYLYKEGMVLQNMSKTNISSVIVFGRSITT